MEDKTTSPAAAPSPAVSLAELPFAVQNFLAFGTIVTALGFEPGAISHRVMGSPAIGGVGEHALCATLANDGREFSVPVGGAVPNLAGWLAHAAELWRSATPAARDALYDRCVFFTGDEFQLLLRSMERAGFRPPIAAGLIVSRLERAGIAGALRRSIERRPGPPLPAARPARASTAAVSARPVGPPRFEIGAVTHLDPDARIPQAELGQFLQRHASGDWGESRYTDHNEAAIHTERPILSAYQTSAGQQLLLITWANPARTTVWPQTGIPYSEGVLLDLVCRYVGTGHRADLPPSAHGALYAVPLIGEQAPNQSGQLERSALAVLAVISSDDTNEVPYRPEQMLRALWQAVETVDFRPIDRDGQRVTAQMTEPRWEAAFERCRREQLAAWFSVAWEDRHA